MRTQELRAGHRFKAVRELFGLTRKELSSVTGIDSIRIKNYEYLNSKVSEDDFYLMCVFVPEFMAFLTVEGDIKLSELKNSSNSFCQSAAGRIENGLIPDGYNLQHYIK